MRSCSMVTKPNHSHQWKYKYENNPTFLIDPPKPYTLEDKAGVMLAITFTGTRTFMLHLIVLETFHSMPKNVNLMGALEGMSGDHLCY